MRIGATTTSNESGAGLAKRRNKRSELPGFDTVPNGSVHDFGQTSVRLHPQWQVSGRTHSAAHAHKLLDTDAAIGADGVGTGCSHHLRGLLGCDPGQGSIFIFARIEREGNDDR